MFDVNKIKKEFPIFKNRDIVYLDNAATTQKPQRVIDSLTNFYSTSNSNVHRGLYDLAVASTKLWDLAHKKVAKYINAQPNEVFFTQGTTSGLNWIARTMEDQVLKKGDVVVISETEHHSNHVPWKFICDKVGCILEEIYMKPDKTLDLQCLDNLYHQYKDKIKVVSVTHMSNVLGIPNDIKGIAEIMRPYGGLLVVDGAQGIVHNRVDVKEMGCDIYIFSGHKIYGPTGVGVVYGKEKVLEKLYPIYGGGEMLEGFSKGQIELAPLPYRFEAGTPNIAQGIGLGEALEWLNGIEGRYEYEDDVHAYLYQKLSEIPEIEILSPKNSKGLVSFFSKKVHNHDIAGDLGEKGICVRAGFHCAQPLHEKFGLVGTVRASLGIYNTKEDADRLVDELEKIIKKY